MTAWSPDTTFSNPLDIPPGLGFKPTCSWYSEEPDSRDCTEDWARANCSPIKQRQQQLAWSNADCPSVKCRAQTREIGYKENVNGAQQAKDERALQDKSHWQMVDRRRGRPLKEIIAELDWVRPRPQPTFELPLAQVDTSHWNEAGTTGAPWSLDPPKRKTMIKNRFLAEGYWTSSETGDDEIDSVVDRDREFEAY